MSNFIKTSDASVAEQLRKDGFHELPKEGQLFVFINKFGPSADFANKDVVFTNNISV